jgi:hypothetical protein
MPHRIMNEHKSRHRTHTVKPANKVIGPLGVVIKATPAAVLGQSVSAVAEVPSVEPTVVEIV